MHFLGIYNFTMDTANRITVPARYREAMGAEVVLLRAPETCLYMYDEQGYARLAQQLRDMSGTVTGRERLRRFYADCCWATVDRTGRLTLPPEFTEYAGIKNDIVLLGAENRFEIWDKNTFYRDNGSPLDCGMDAYPEIMY